MTAQYRAVRRVLALLLAPLLLSALFPPAVFAALESPSNGYAAAVEPLDVNGVHDEATLRHNIANGIDVVLSAAITMEVPEQACLEVKKDLTIDLNGYTLSIELNNSAFDRSCIEISGGAVLTICDKSENGGGKLIAKHSATKGSIDGTITGNGAGINTSGGTLIIESGIVEAYGSCRDNPISESGGAGIGGGYRQNGGNITIGGSAHVTAYGGRYGAGIGGGGGGDAGTVHTSGGKITIEGNAVVIAVGGAFAAGIGGGGEGHSGDVLIGGNAQVTAYNGFSAAGIGGGGGGHGKNGARVTIRDQARVFAFGSTVGAGIGGGESTKPGAGDISKSYVTIEGGIVNAQRAPSEMSAAMDIGSGKGQAAGETKITGGSVFLKNNEINGFSADPASANPQLYLVKVTVKDESGVFVDGAVINCISQADPVFSYSAKTSHISVERNTPGEEIKEPGVVYLWLPKGSYDFTALTDEASGSVKGFVVQENHFNELTVPIYVPVTGLTLPDSVSLRVGDIETLQAEIIPANADRRGITWSAVPVDQNFVSFDENATGETLEITALHVGRVTIRAVSDDNPSAYAECVVVVSPQIPSPTPPDTPTAIYGQQLNEITLPEYYEWDNPDDYVGSAGSQTHDAVYDLGNLDYEVITVQLGVTVNRAPLTPSIDFTDIDDKVYDGNTDVIGSPAIRLNGAVLGESPTATAMFAFEDPNAGADKVVCANNITLEGDWGDNYILSTDQLHERGSVSGQREVSIQTRDLHIIASQGFEKEYDGNKSVIGGLGALVFQEGNLIAADAAATVDATGVTAEYIDANAGTNKQISLTGTFLMANSANSTNYNIIPPVLYGTIRPKSLASVVLTVTPPAVGETPGDASPFENSYIINGGTQWSSPDGGTPTLFAADTVYTMRAVLTPVSPNYVFASGVTATVNDSPATTVTLNADGTVTVTLVFPQTGPQSVVSIVIEAEPTQLSYFSGGTPDVTGLQVRAIYNDGSTAIVSNELLSFSLGGAEIIPGLSPLSYAAHNGQHLRISYGAAQAVTSGTVSVSKLSVNIDSATGMETGDAVSLVSSAQVEAGETVEIGYTLADSLLQNELTLRALHSGKEVAVIRTAGSGTISYTADYGDSDGAGVITLRPVFYHADIITSADVALTEPQNGETPDLNLTVIAPLRSGVPYFTSAVTWNTSDPVFRGEKAYTATVTLTANQGVRFAASFVPQAQFGTVGNISVAQDGSSVVFDIRFDALPERQLRDVRVIQEPSQLAYLSGDTLDVTGIQLEAVYDDGTAETVLPDAYAINGTAVSHSVTVMTNAAHDGRSITVFYQSESALTVPLTVDKLHLSAVVSGSEAADSVSLSTDWADTGETVTVNYHLSDIAIVNTLTFNHGLPTVSAPASASVPYTVRRADADYSGQITLTALFRHSDELTEAPVTAEAPAKGMMPNPALTGAASPYFDGTVAWDTSGPFLGATSYTATITLYAKNAACFTPGFRPVCSQGAPQNIIVSADGLRVSFTLRFPPLPDREALRVELTAQPSRLSYLSGDTLSAAGLALTAFYDDSTSGTISPDAYAIDGVAFTPGVTVLSSAQNGKALTVFYRGMSVQTELLWVQKLTVRIGGVSGAETDDSVSLTTAAWDAGDSVAIAYTLGKSKSVNQLSWNRSIAPVTVMGGAGGAENGTLYYTVRRADTDAAGGDIISLTALFSHTDMIMTAEVGVETPVKGTAPRFALTGSPSSLFSGAVTVWSPDDPVFLGGKAYSATVTLYASGSAAFDDRFLPVVIGGTIENCTVIANGGTAIFTVRFPPLPEALPQLVALSAQPTLLYISGDALDVSGLLLTASYDDGTAKPVTPDGYAIEGLNITPGVTALSSAYTGKALTVFYQGMSAQTDALNVRKLAVRLGTVEGAQAGDSLHLEALEWDAGETLHAAYTLADSSPYNALRFDKGFSAVYTAGSGNLSYTVAKEHTDAADAAAITLNAVFSHSDTPIDGDPGNPDNPGGNPGGPGGPDNPGDNPDGPGDPDNPGGNPGGPGDPGDPGENPGDPDNPGDNPGGPGGNPGGGGDNPDDPDNPGGNPGGPGDPGGNPGGADLTEPEHGDIIIEPAEPKPGDEVTVIIQPEEGYEPDTLIITDENGNPVPYVDNGDNTYTYIQPEGKVRITVTFRKINPPDRAYKLLITDRHVVYMQGVGGNLFAPDANMTRAEAAQMLFNLLRNQKVQINKHFSDVPEDAWYAQAVHALCSLNIMQGYPDGTFRPPEPVTRAEFTVFLVQLAGVSPGRPRFDDVTETYWAYHHIGTAAAWGWVLGVDGKHFEPDRQITRGEAVALMNRVLVRPGDTAYIAVNPALNRFSDVSPTDWAFGSILEATVPHGYRRDGLKEIWESLVLEVQPRKEPEPIVVPEGEETEEPGPDPDNAEIDDDTVTPKKAIHMLNNLLSYCAVTQRV